MVPSVGTWGYQCLLRLLWGLTERVYVKCFGKCLEGSKCSKYELFLPPPWAHCHSNSTRQIQSTPFYRQVNQNSMSHSQGMKSKRDSPESPFNPDSCWQCQQLILAEFSVLVQSYLETLTLLIAGALTPPSPPTPAPVTNLPAALLKARPSNGQ